MDHPETQVILGIRHRIHPETQVTLDIRHRIKMSKVKNTTQKNKKMSNMTPSKNLV
jgi:hypothetical protein